MLSGQYVSALRGFEVDLSSCIGTTPDISKAYEEIRVVWAIADQAIGALYRYSVFLARNPIGRNSIEAHILLPQRIRPLFPCDAIEDLRNWARSFVASGELPRLAQVLRRIRGRAANSAGRKSLKFVADTLARIGIGMAPDARFGLRRPKPSEPVVLFRLPRGPMHSRQLAASTGAHCSRSQQGALSPAPTGGSRPWSAVRFKTWLLKPTCQRPSAATCAPKCGGWQPSLPQDPSCDGD